MGKDELYDIAQDPGQEHNLAGVYSEALNKMRAFYEGWWAKTKSQAEKLIPVFIGSNEEGETILSSNDWADGYVNTQWAVAQAAGSVKGGVWHIKAVKKGKYQFELSRWPFHLNRDLTIEGPDKAVGGTKLRTGRAVRIAFGCLSLNGKEPVVVKKSIPKAKNIRIEMDVLKGDNTLQLWFKDATNQDVCGAYYVRVKRIP